MKEQRARQILQALVQGVDPLNGEELPGGTVLQQAEVMRALLAGAAALEERAARAQRRSQLPRNIGRAWSDEEHGRLVDAFKAGEALAGIASRHDRTLRAIESRLEKFGLITRSQRMTGDRFGSEQPPTARPRKRAKR